MDIAELLNRKPVHPVGCDTFHVHFANLSQSSSQPLQKIPHEDEDMDAVRSSPYTVEDDLSMLKVVAYYYGSNFSGKIPWSFWQTYKRVTGSKRSNSSLYHHWNGSMRKKYDKYIESGKLSECIQWLEGAVISEHPPVYSEFSPAGMPLYHSVSGPSIPLVAPGPFEIQYQQPRMIRATSLSPITSWQVGYYPH